MIMFFKKIQLKYEMFIILLNKLKMNLKFILLKIILLIFIN
jgi:hypothetical protein